VSTRPPTAADTSLTSVVGQRVRAMRELHSLTQSELGSAVGISRSSVANIETGRQTVPLALLAALAQHFGVGVSVLVGEADLPALPSVTVQPTCLVTCSECGVLDEDVPPEEAGRQRTQHLTAHLSLASRTTEPTPPPTDDGAAVIRLPQR